MTHDTVISSALIGKIFTRLPHHFFRIPRPHMCLRSVSLADYDPAVTSRKVRRNSQDFQSRLKQTPP
jgi:hypothetical protein